MKKHVMLLSVALLAWLSALSYAQAPVPFINLPLVPDAAPPGGNDFTLTVNGTGFASDSVVNWNGTPLATQFVNGSQLTAIVPAADIATGGSTAVTVMTPAPGGGVSNDVFFEVAANVGDNVEFNLTSSPDTGDEPSQVAIADFNGDGKLDAAITNSASGTLTILLGDGAGNFILASSPDAGSNPASVAVGDFNGDGKPDLAVSNYGDGNVSVFLGDGAGKFTLASSTPVGYAPWVVVTADFNRDGKLDLAVGKNDQGSNTISILLGDGTGKFTRRSSPVAGYFPWSLAMGDFNADGNLDLAVANLYAGTVSVLLGNGRGNFALASSVTTDSLAEEVATGDFNGDGKLDLAVVGSPIVSVFLGDGTGNFNPTPPLPTGYNSDSIALGDFNGDGTLDVAVANYTWQGTISVLLGDGTGNFSPALFAPAGPWGFSIAVGDFNGDGTLDLATTNYQNASVSIVLGVPPKPAVTLSPASLTFGTQLVLTASSPQMVTLTNTGGATLGITSITASLYFSEKNNCGSSLAAGASCTIGVVFKPHQVGTITGTVTITDNAPDSPQTVPLTGVGTAVTLLPSSLDFGSQPTGTTGQPKTVTLTNYGDRAVSIYGGTFRGNNPGSFVLQNNTCGNSLPAGASCTISVAFAPKSPGLKTATLEVRDNGGPSPQTVALSGTGTQ